MKTLSGNSIDKFLLVVLFASLGANCLQAYKARNLRQNAAAARISIPPDNRFSFQDLNLTRAGAAFDPTKSGKPTVLYILSPTCGWCKLNEKNIDWLSQQVADKYNVVGGVPSEKPDDTRLETMHYPFSVYSMTFSLGPATQLAGTPQTLVFSPSGELLKRWPGYYSEDNKKSIQEYFNVKFPKA